MYGQSQSSFGDTIFSFGASYGAPNMATIRTTGFGSTVFGKDKFGNSVRIFFCVYCDQIL